jgi:hypothetical protein
VSWLPGGELPQLGDRSGAVCQERDRAGGQGAGMRCAGRRDTAGLTRDGRALVTVRTAVPHTDLISEVAFTGFGFGFLPMAE